MKWIVIVLYSLGCPYSQAFVEESNAIEGIRLTRPVEVEEFLRFLALPKITIAELERFVSVYQPNAKLRDKAGLNVRVGNHIPLAGGPLVRQKLQEILDSMEHDGPYVTHRMYETLHPFTDGNGRSGRALWAWQYRDLSLGFLHRWYYQSLDQSR